MARAYFNESQRFRQWWIYLIIVMTIATWIFVFFSSAQEEDPDKSISTLGLIGGSIIPVLLIIMLIILRLVTKIRDDGIYIQFKPLQFKQKHIKLEEIKSFEVRKYKPLTEYGGWGLRSGLNTRGHGKAYNVSGNMGLQLYLANGKKLLIELLVFFPQPVVPALELVQPLLVFRTSIQVHLGTKPDNLLTEKIQPALEHAALRFFLGCHNSRRIREHWRRLQ